MAETKAPPLTPVRSPDPRAARTVIYYYDGDVRASDVPSGSPVTQLA